MINNVLYKIFRSNKNWDPVSSKYAEEYHQSHLNKELDSKYFKMLERVKFNYLNAKILDIGAGPGIYSVEFAKLGSTILWQDVSRSFYEIAKKKFKSKDYRVFFSLEHIEVCMKKQKDLDLIFSRLSFYYAKNDKEFFDDASKSLKMNGYLLIDCNTYERFDNNLSLFGQLQVLLYHKFQFKIGHPLPNHEMIDKLAKKSGFIVINKEFNTKSNICILLQKIT